ncbi:MAG: LysM peptidoglycan-binding domain-containing protein, partial [Cytophagaceae bacterium]
KIYAPNEGVELLYIHGENKNRALVNPNGFPYMNLNFDPYSSTLRKNNHHTLHEVGFDYINDIISNMVEKSGDDFNKYFKYLGDTIVNGRNCYKILIDYVDFAYYNYTIKAGENITDIAYRLHLSDYMILEINNLSDYTSAKAGTVIKLPNVYARKTYLCIDRINYMPILQEMHDEKGLFSKYEFLNLQINPVIAPEEFTSSYKDYKF